MRRPDWLRVEDLNIEQCFGLTLQGYKALRNRPNAPGIIAQDEPSVKQDRDGDGVVDFDEINRFKDHFSGANQLSPITADSDGDGIRDLQEISNAYP